MRNKSIDEQLLNRSIILFSNLTQPPSLRTRIFEAHKHILQRLRLILFHISACHHEAERPLKKRISHVRSYIQFRFRDHCASTWFSLFLPDPRRVGSKVRTGGAAGGQAPVNNRISINKQVGSRVANKSNGLIDVARIFCSGFSEKLQPSAYRLPFRNRFFTNRVLFSKKPDKGLAANLEHSPHKDKCANALLNRGSNPEVALKLSGW